MRRSSLILSVILTVLTLRTSSAQVYCPQLGQQSLSNSSYAIDKNGKLWAWGANERGELGIGSLTDQNIPVQVALPLGAGGWVRIAGGSNFALAVADSDRLYAFGANSAGQLGIGNTTDESTPSRITNPTGVTAWHAISAGEDHAVALSNSGALYAWGSNDRGQLGTGDQVNYKTPHVVPFPKGVRSWTAVAAGAGFTVAVSDRGELFAWGFDSSGVWGVMGVNPPTKVTTERVSGTGWLPSIGAGNRSLVAALSTGNSFTPGLTRYSPYTIAVTAGTAHQMFLDWAGRLYARGDNLYGQLGVTDPFANSSTIQSPPGVKQWIALAAGRRHSLALGNDGNLYAWGDNAHGQLGIGTNSTAMEPMLVRSFCDPVKGTATLTNSDTRTTSFHFDATLHDTAQATLIGPTSHMSAPFPVVLLGNAKQPMNPYTLMNGDSATVRFDATVDSSINYTAGVLGYAYIYSIGSAPIIVPKVISLNVHRAAQPVRITIVDSLTRKPLANVEVQVQGVDTLVTDSTGSFVITNRQEQLVLLLERENYSSETVTLAMPPSSSISGMPDSVIDTVMMAPSAIVGHALLSSSWSGMLRVIAADSSARYGFVGEYLYGSTDSGSTWQSLMKAADTLRDIAFVNSDVGYAVGDNGLIIRIDRKSITYSVLHPFPLTVRLNAVCAANHALWIVGDSGTVVRLSPSGVWSRETIPGTSLIGITSLDTAHAIAVAASGRLYDRLDSRGWVPMTTGSDATRAYLVEPDLLYYISPEGGLYYTYPSDVTLSGRYVGYVGFRTKPTGNGRLYFLNKVVGFAVGEDTVVPGDLDSTYRAPASSGILVTYDGGVHWARVASITPWNQPTAALGIDAIGLQVVTTTHNVNTSSGSTYTFGMYPMTAGPLSAVLTGRFIDRDGITGIAGGRVTLHGADGNDYVTYTTEKGYYVLTDIPASLDVQNVDLSFMDSTGVWTRSDAVTLSAGNVTRLDFAHPRTNSVVEIGKSGSADGLRLTRYSHDNGVAENLRDLSFELAGIEDAAAHIDAQLFDVLGRPMRATVLRMNTAANGITFDLEAGAIPSGVYICVVRTADGREASCRVVRK